MKLKFPISKAWLKPYLHRTLPWIAACSMALVEAAQAAPGDLIITEINSNGTGGDFWELTNVSASSINFITTLAETPCRSSKLHLPFLPDVTCLYTQMTRDKPVSWHGVEIAAGGKGVGVGPRIFFFS
jgi:hypothetical protein